MESDSPCRFLRVAASSNRLKYLVRPAGFEPTIPWFVGRFQKLTFITISHLQCLQTSIPVYPGHNLVTARLASGTIAAQIIFKLWSDPNRPQRPRGSDVTDRRFSKIIFSGRELPVLRRSQTDPERKFAGSQSKRGAKRR